jgi:hypothetical protein
LALMLIAAAFSAGTARAQDINEGRSPSQMFAAVCATCHQSPRGLGRHGAAALAGFLRQHYTTSREQAAVLAGYVASFANQPAAAQPPGPRPPAEVGRPGQPASPAARRRAPGEEGRLEQQTTAPAGAAGARQPRAPDTRPGRARVPAEAAAQAPAAAAQAPAPPTPVPAGDMLSTDGITSAVPEAPSTARTDDIAD